MKLVERLLAMPVLYRAVAAAAEGRGSLVLVAGEPGAGKTTAVRHFAQACGDRADVFWGACDPVSTLRPLGPLLDVAGGLGRDVEALLEEASDRDRIFRAVLGALRSGDAIRVLVLEDVHWADEATLDLLAFLARRIADARVLLVATYRDDEVGATHPLTAVIGDLATSSSVHRAAVPRLFEEEVRELAAGTTVDPAELHRRTGGNPFFVTEILAVPGGHVPETVRDAVLARASRLSQAARGRLDAASAIGLRVEPWLLSALTDDDVEPVEECLALGVLQSSRTLLRFRHEIAREVVLASLSPQRRQDLHRRILALLRATPTIARPEGLARLAHHAEEAQDARSVLELAPAAALHAARLDAHREAAAQYARALRFAAALPPDECADLYERRSYECYLTSDSEEASRARCAALALRRAAGDELRIGENLRWLSRLSWFMGRGEEAAALAVEATEVLERRPAGSELGWAYSNRAQLCMLAFDVDGAVRWGNRALGLATRLGDLELRVHAMTNIGTALFQSGSEEGLAMLETSLKDAREHDLGEHAARAFTNIASVAVNHRRLALANEVLHEGIAYCSDRDLDSWRLYMLGWRALLDCASGRWNEAADVALEMLAHRGLPPVSRIQPLVVLGMLRARRGDPGAGAALDEALELAAGTGELERLAPVAVARAEAAWLEGRGEDEAGLLQRTLDLAAEKGDAWAQADLGYWRWKCGGEALPRNAAPTPYHLQTEGRWRDAVAVWEECGCTYQALLARAEGDDRDTLHRAHEELVRMGARAVAPRVVQRLRALGMDDPPEGGRPTRRGDPSQLTRRQRQVLELMAEGLSNAAIAERLFRSTKTVDHHVSAVLAKLEAANRVEAVRKAMERSLVRRPGSDPVQE